MKIKDGIIYLTEEEIAGSAAFEHEVATKLDITPDSVSMLNRAEVAVSLLKDLTIEEIASISDLMLIAARDYLSGLNDAISTITHGLDSRQLEVFKTIEPIADRLPSRLKKLPVNDGYIN